MKYFLGKQHIFIISEYLENPNILSEILSSKGYVIQQMPAEVPKSKKIGEHLGLIILDIQTSNTWAIELLLKLKSSGETKNIPVILLSTHTETVDKKKAFEANCYDYITKPYTAGELFVRVENCLKLHQYHMQLENMIQERTAELEQRTLSLEESNIALKVLLKQRDKDKEELNKNILFSIENLVKPSLTHLIKNTSDNNQKTYLKIIESNLNQIISPFASNLSDNLSKLTPSQTQIANFIQQGKTTKEIADLLCLSPSTIANQRQRIRKTFNLTNKKRNLQTILSLNMK